MASIHKKKLRTGGVVWELTEGKGDKRIRFVAGRSKEEAEATLRSFQRQKSLHGAPPGDISVSEALARYGEYLLTNRSPGTVRRYLRVLRTFGECFLATHYPKVSLLRDLKPYHLEAYKEGRIAGTIEEIEDDSGREEELRRTLQENPTAPERRDNAKFGWLGRKRLKSVITKKTVNYELQTLATFLRWCVRRNLIFTNPADLVERFKLPKRAIPKFMTTDELSAFFAACDPWERRIFSILFLSGMRRGELVNLEWADVRFDLKVILIRAKENWRPKTDERVIPITPALERVLREEHRVRRSPRFVCANRAGNQEIHLLPKLKKICRKAGITPAAATLHALRHSFGSHLSMAGVPLANIADLMGHRDLATTQIYAKVEVEHLREAVSRLSPLVPEEKEVSLVCVTPAGVSPRAKPKLLNSGELEAGNLAWLGGRDSNPDSAVQSRMSYH
jgi:site-specific recombinase XerD